MIEAVQSPETCRRSGVVLTCYLDGRKLFRALRMPCPAKPPAPVKRRRDA